MSRMRSDAIRALGLHHATFRAREMRRIRAESHAGDSYDRCVAAPPDANPPDAGPPDADPPSPASRPAPAEEALLENQIAYYRARVPDYDDWWFRRGAHDVGEAFSRRWHDEVGRVREAFDAFEPKGDVLEMAAGTGNWTLEIARHADRITAVDAAPEAFEVARLKLGAVEVPIDWVVADLFAWEPPRRYDVVCFSFWLSHVPLARFDEFWGLVDAALAPGGRVFFLDNAHPSLGGPAIPRRFRTVGSRIEGVGSWTDLDTGVSTRTTADGRAFDIVKVFWEPEPLRRRLKTLGWDVEVATTNWAFIHGQGGRAS